MVIAWFVAWRTADDRAKVGRRMMAKKD